MKRELKNLPEIELIAMAKLSDKREAEKAFQEIYSRYKSAIRFMLLKSLSNISHEIQNADDLLQIVFEKAFKNIHSFQPDYKISTWLMRIGKNLVVDVLRKKGLSMSDVTTVDDEGVETTMDFDSNDLNPEEIAEKEQRNSFVHELIEKKLQGEYKEIIMLRFFEEKSYDEIAEIMDLPLGTVKAKLFRAKELLAEGLNKSVLITA